MTGFLGMWLDRYPDPSEPDADVTLNVYYHATAGAEVGVADPAETSELGWFEPDDLPRRSPSRPMPNPCSPPGARR